jgi:integrase
MTLKKRGYYWVTDLNRPGRRRDKNRVFINTNQTNRGLALAVESQMRLGLRDARRGTIPKHKRGKTGRRNPLKFGEAVDRYIQTVMLAGITSFEQGVPETVANEMYRTEKLVKYFGYTTAVSKVAKWKAIAEFNREMLKTMAKASANRLLSMLRAVLNKCYEWGDLGQPAYVRLNKTRSQREYVLLPKEEQKLIRACDPGMADLVVFLLDTGARLSEALSLTWRHVNLRRKRPTVTFTRTKTRYDRAVPLPKRAATMMRRRHAAHSESDDLVFSEPADRMINNKYGQFYCNEGDWIPLPSAYPRFIMARKTAGLSQVRFHDLRHTYATKLVQGGVPLFEVGKLLGHRTLKMTMRYSHHAVGNLDSAVAVLD